VCARAWVCSRECLCAIVFFQKKTSLKNDICTFLCVCFYTTNLLTSACARTRALSFSSLSYLSFSLSLSLSFSLSLSSLSPLSLQRTLTPSLALALRPCTLSQHTKQHPQLPLQSPAPRARSLSVSPLSLSSLFSLALSLALFAHLPPPHSLLRALSLNSVAIFFKKTYPFLFSSATSVFDRLRLPCSSSSPVHKNNTT
jgi:hypothetical protein